jgi:hypothetical protein
MSCFPSPDHQVRIVYGPVRVSSFAFKEGTLTIFNALDVGTTGGAKDRLAALEIANATVNVAGELTITGGGVLALDTGFAINGPLVNGGFVPNAALTADGGTIRTLAALTIPNNVTLA